MNPKDEAGQKKLPLHLVPPALEIVAAEAMAEGADKYGPYNWRDGSPIYMSVYLGAMKRHLAAMLDGEDVDPESTTGKTHLAGLVACAAIIADASALGQLIDDRVPGPAPDMIRERNG